MNNQSIFTISILLAMLSGFMTVHFTFLAIKLGNVNSTLFITLFLVLTILFGVIAGYHLRGEENGNN